MSKRVSLASDDRGRIPFAVLGVLVLVSSLALAPTLSTTPAPDDTAVERALAEATAESQAAVRDGVATAGRRAAENPVVRPADTPPGRALNESQPFRDALRLRVYLQVRDRLDRLGAEHDGVTATASLPAVDSTADYERAIDRVSVERAGPNGTALRATVENVTLTARRGGEVVTRRTVTRSVVVPSPVLYLHERVGTYERRLNADLSHPGLTQRTTARLYPIAWARGYAQYGGAPISNVVANRHVSLATNGGLLGVQRSVFGRSDPEGRQALTEATAVTGVHDIAAATTSSDAASQILSRASYRPASENISTGGDAVDAPRANESMTVGINETADRAFSEVAEPSALTATASRAYTVEARLVTERESLRGGVPDRPDSPGGGWQFTGGHTTARASLAGTASGRPSTREGWHTLDRFGRLVEVEYRRVATWDNATRPPRTTVSERTELVRVTGAVVGRHNGSSVAPDRGLATAHDPGESPLDGPNLADVEPSAERQLLDGGPGDVAKRVALGGSGQRTVSVTGGLPDGLYAWLYRDLRELRETVRAINTTVERGAVGTFEANAARQLRAKLDRRRAELVDAPETYDSAAQRARVAARIAYLDAVDDRLAERVEGNADVESRFADVVEGRTGGSLAELRRGLTARETRVPASRPPPVGPAGPVRTRVDAQPQYLTLAEVSQSEFPAVEGSEHPLVARNVNVFSVPYGDAAGAIVDRRFGATSRASLHAASKTLAAANRAEFESNETLERRRDALREAVQDANEHVAAGLAERVAAETGADAATSNEIVSLGLGRWETTAARGQALANGSAAERIATVAAARQDLSTVEADWLELRLRRTTTQTVSTAGARPATGLVNGTASAVRTVGRERLRMALSDELGGQVEGAARRRLGTRTLPAGAPLAPPVTPWYATVNVWWVTVEGEYARFAVSANHGPPTAAGATVTYAREDGAVTLDADDDGTAETLGHNERIDFRVDTGVVVVVPPRPRGVGDKGGDSVETSGGWPEPG